MKILLSHPYCWPEVRRGGERLFEDLSRYLAEAGHEVTSVSTLPAAELRHLPRCPGRIRHRAVPDLRLPRRLELDRPVSYLPAAAASIVRHRPDVVHGMFHLDGVAARLAAPLSGRRPYLVHIQGMPRRDNLERRRLHRALFGPSVARAADVLTVSRAAAEALEEEFGIRARPVLNGVWTDAYAGVRSGQRSVEPSILFPADPNDPRKRLTGLVEAMGRLEEPWRTARLLVAGEPSPRLRAELEGRVGSHLEVLGVGDPDAMTAAYARAWITCLPAVREAFGLVIIESLAAGRPCVAIRDGGVPEVLGEPAWLAAPDDPDDLAAALTRALTAAGVPGTAERCRELARPFDWSVRGPEFEAVYRELVPSARPARGGHSGHPGGD